MPRERFERILGANNVLYRPLDLSAYAYDASTLTMMPEFVLFPHTLEEMHQLILYCDRIKKPYVIRGKGSGHQGGCLGDGIVVVDMSRFNTVSSVENDIVTAGAGVSVGLLQEHLEKLGKRLGWEFGYADTMSVGGAISINGLHKYSLRQGRVVDDVIEITVFDATGKLYTLRGKEMEKYAGTEGRLGIILSAKLKVYSKKEYATEVQQFDDVRSLMSEVEALKLDDDVVSVEFLDKRASGMCELGERYTLIYETTGITRKKGIADKIMIRKALKGREQVSSLLKRQGFNYEEDSMVALPKLPELLAFLESAGRPCYGHIGIGLIHSHWRRDEDRSKLYGTVARLSGESGAQFGYGIVKAKYTPVQVRNKIKRLLPVHNPHDMLNPGKMIREVMEGEHE